MICTKCNNSTCRGHTESFLWDETQCFSDALKRWGVKLDENKNHAAVPPNTPGALRFAVPCPYGCGCENVVWIKQEISIPRSLLGISNNNQNQVPSTLSGFITSFFQKKDLKKSLNKKHSYINVFGDESSQSNDDTSDNDTSTTIKLDEIQPIRRVNIPINRPIVSRTPGSRSSFSQ